MLVAAGEEEEAAVEEVGSQVTSVDFLFRSWTRCKAEAEPTKKSASCSFCPKVPVGGQLPGSRRPGAILSASSDLVPSCSMRVASTPLRWR